MSPIVAALDQPEVTLDPDTAPVVALSLVEALAQIPDPRKARGIRHGVLAIVLLGACAVLTGRGRSPRSATTPMTPAVRSSSASGSGR